MTLNAGLITLSTSHIHNILKIAFNHTSQHTAIVVFDQRCNLAKILTAAFQQNLPDAHFIDFDAATPEFILETFCFYFDFRCPEPDI